MSTEKVIKAFQCINEASSMSTAIDKISNTVFDTGLGGYIPDFEVCQLLSKKSLSRDEASKLLVICFSSTENIPPPKHLVERLYVELGANPEMEFENLTARELAEDFSIEYANYFAETLPVWRLLEKVSDCTTRQRLFSAVEKYTFLSEAINTGIISTLSDFIATVEVTGAIHTPVKIQSMLK